MRVLILICFACALSAQRNPAFEAIEKSDELYRAGKMQEAEALLTQALAANPDPMSAAVIHGNVAVIYQDTGKPKEAEEAYRRALELLPKISDPEAAQTLRLRLSGSLASLYLEEMQAGKAERILREYSLEQLPENEDGVRIRGSIASLHMVRGRMKEAERIYLSLLDWWKARDRHTDAAVVLNNLAVIAMENGDAVVATGRLENALEHWKKAGIELHPLLLRTMANYGCALLQTRQHERARPVLQQTLELARKWYGEESIVTARVAIIYALALEATGNKKEAKALVAGARKITDFDPRRHTVDILDLRAQPNR